MEQDSSHPSTEAPAMSKIMKLDNSKAGMEGLDVEYINNVIEQASKGSKFYQKQKQRQEQNNKRIVQLKQQMQLFTAERVEGATKHMDKLAREFEETRNLDRIIVHIDMDAFYAAVEMRDNPELKEKPMAVGGNSMLSTSNYLARRYGVRAAMPGFIARKLCPQIVIVPVNFSKYESVSKAVRSVLATYDPGFCPMSLDEAYLDITDHMFKTGQTAEETVQEMRLKIFETTQLTASAGIAPNMMIAKVCSNKNKPNGQFCLPNTREAVMSFIDPLPIRAITGIGSVNEQLLNAIGVRTCGDLWRHRGVINLLFTPVLTRFLLRVSLGIGSTSVRSDDPRKSIGVERTFGDISGPDELQEKCRELCESLVESMSDEAIKGRTVVLKLKTSAFDVIQRSQGIASHTSNVEQIYAAARKLLSGEIAAAAPHRLCIRLMGVRMTHLLSEDEQSTSRHHQLTLDSFLLSGSSKKMLSFECPVCRETVNGTLKDFNSHVDKCLTEGEENPGCSNNNEVPMDVEPSGIEARCPVCGKVQAVQFNDHVEDCLSNGIASSNIGDSSSKQYECPVCNKTLPFRDLTEFNAHLDGCLNREAISELVSIEHNTSDVRTEKKGGLKRLSVTDSPIQARKKLKKNFNGKGGGAGRQMVMEMFLKRDESKK